MKLECGWSDTDDAFTWTLTISPAEITTSVFHGIDRRVIAESSADDATISDVLLGLELVARRIEEAQKVSA